MRHANDAWRTFREPRRSGVRRGSSGSYSASGHCFATTRSTCAARHIAKFVPGGTRSCSGNDSAAERLCGATTRRYIRFIGERFEERQIIVRDANSQLARRARSTQTDAQQWPACAIALEVRSVSNVIQRASHASMMMRKAKTPHRVDALLTGGKTRMKSILNGNKPVHLDARVQKNTSGTFAARCIATLAPPSSRRRVPMWANAQSKHVRVMYCLAAQERR
ncbi:hypothetical protein OKW46_001214 [Paraburkholderia sp. WSM4179]|nr:hypothetical protein [Paraburkholderia sp. WSM4179]